jgi:hypothetical protein
MLRLANESVAQTNAVPHQRRNQFRFRAAALKLITLALALLLASASFAQDVKENKMGMTMDEFKTLHAKQFKGMHVARCYADHFHEEALSPGEQMCYLPGGDVKLAKVSVRSWKAYFYNGMLYRILYKVDPKGYFDIDYVLIDLYGQPLKQPEEKAYAPPDDLSESPGLNFQLGDAWSSGDMHINMWYTESTPEIYETPAKKNCTVEFVLESVLDSLYKSGKPRKRRESL